MVVLWPGSSRELGNRTLRCQLMSHMWYRLFCYNSWGEQRTWLILLVYTDSMFIFAFFEAVFIGLTPGAHWFGGPRWSCWFFPSCSFLPVSRAPWTASSSSSSRLPCASPECPSLSSTPAHLRRQTTLASKIPGRRWPHNLEKQQGPPSEYFPVTGWRDSS